MGSADYFFSPETPFPAKPSEHRCPACEALYLETKELIRQIEAAETYAEAMKRKALVEKAERDRLLGLLFFSKPQAT